MSSYSQQAAREILINLIALVSILCAPQYIATAPRIGLPILVR